MKKRFLVFNHEVWRKCKNCGAYFDLRTFDYVCPECKSEQ